MKLLLPAILFLSASASLFADEDKASQDVQKIIDTKKYCYYANLEYSKGAIMEQAGKTMQCVTIQNSRYKNTKAEKGTLVWQEVKK